MNDAPTSEEIEAVQEEYIAALVKLFETHRAEYDPKALDIEIVWSEGWVMKSIKEEAQKRTAFEGRWRTDIKEWGNVPSLA